MNMYGTFFNLLMYIMPVSNFIFTCPMLKMTFHTPNKDHHINTALPLVSIQHYLSYRYSTTSHWYSTTSHIDTALPLISIQHYLSYWYSTTSHIDTALPLTDTAVHLISIQHYLSYRYSTTSPVPIKISTFTFLTL